MPTEVSNSNGFTAPVVGAFFTNIALGILNTNPRFLEYHMVRLDSATLFVSTQTVTPFAVQYTGGSFANGLQIPVAIGTNGDPVTLTETFWCSSQATSVDYGS